MRWSTLEELAAEAGVPVPDVASVARSGGGFARFIDLYFAACAVIRGPDELYRLFREVAEDAAASGVVWVEVHVDTTLHRSRLGPDELQLELYLEGARCAEDATGVGVGLVMAADRTLDPAIAVEQARLAATAAGRGVVAFGLANDESVHPPEAFAPAFAIARDAGLLCTPHAGELAGPESVRAALDTLDPDRIGHGVRAVEEPDLLRRLADAGVVCDLCPTSNVVIGLYPSVEDHPVRQFLDAGVGITLNSDDPLMFDSPLAAEYRLVRDAFGLGDGVMASIARTSIVASGMPEERQRAALTAVEDWLS